MLSPAGAFMLESGKHFSAEKEMPQCDSVWLRKIHAACTFSCEEIQRDLHTQDSTGPCLDAVPERLCGLAKPPLPLTSECCRSA